MKRKGTRKFNSSKVWRRIFPLQIGDRVLANDLPMFKNEKGVIVDTNTYYSSYNTRTQRFVTVIEYGIRFDKKERADGELSWFVKKELKRI